MLLSPNPPAAPRLSQLLPHVKCSNCSASVPLAELGEHVCAPGNSSSSSPQPASSSSTISQRRGNDALKLGSVSSDSSRRSDYKPKAGSPLREHRSALSVSSRSSSISSRTRSISSVSSQRKPSISSMRRPSISSSSSSPPPPPPPPSLPTPRSPQPPSRTATPMTLPSSPAPSRQKSPAPIPRQMPVSPPPRLPHQSTSSFGAPQRLQPEPDTKSGGEAGMAGVGRRGFAAVAHAAMLFTHQPINNPSGQFRRPYAPQLLDIDAAIRTTSTPPLTTSGYSSSNGPISPLSPLSHRIPSPVSPVFPINAVSPDLPPLHNPTSTAPRHPSPPSPDTPRAGVPTRSLSKSTTASSTSGLRISFGLSERSKSTKRRTIRTEQSSDSEYGLAYADSTDYEEEEDEEEQEDGNKNKSRHVSGRSSYGALLKSKAEPPPPLPLGGSILLNGFNNSRLERSNSTSSSSSSNYSDRDREPTPVAKPSHTRQSSSAKIAHALGLSQKSPGAYTSGRLGGPGGPGSSKPVRTPSANGLEKQMDDLLKQVDAPLSSSPTRDSFELRESRTRPSLTGAHRSNTVGVGARKNSEDMVANKLPARANTEKASTGADREKKKVKVCLRCEKRVEDGRWIKTDSGGGLCERCWKNMYLPKCRRCNKPIEKQAVSSSDGQLKGKYHKDCFNCATCHKPFPNKTFYVFEGKPMCAYHYAEANDSLCAAATCGQPIEGPCAVSHAGDQYHPQHLLCEFPSGVPGKQGCMERLEEYWEVDGRMLCERHANVMSRRAGRSSDDDEPPAMSKAMKRTTRFIDLNLGGDIGGFGASGLR